MLAKAKAVNWVSSLTDALNGEAAEYQYKGTAHAEAHGLVTMDGTVRTGLERYQSLKLDWDSTTGTIIGGTVNAGDIPIDFWITQEGISSDLVEDLANAKASLALYPNNASLQAYYAGEVTRLEGLLSQDGLLAYSSIRLAGHGFTQAAPSSITRPGQR